MSADEASYRFEFETTLDEIVDVQLRMAYATKTFARQRRNQVIWTGLAATVTAPLTFLYKVQQELGLAPPTSLVIGVVTLSVVVGMLLGFLAGRYFDWRVRRYVRRTLEERYAGATHVKLEIETRPEGLWCRSSGIEATLAWAQLARINDTADAIEFWFSPPALIRLPSRVFSSNGERQELRRAVTTRAPQIQQTSSAHVEDADR